MSEIMFDARFIGPEKIMLTEELIKKLIQQGLWG